MISDYFTQVVDLYIARVTANDDRSKSKRFGYATLLAKRDAIDQFTRRYDGMYIYVCMYMYMYVCIGTYAIDRKAADVSWHTYTHTHTHM